MQATTHRHPIQLFILERLRIATTGLRYSDMRPANTENDLYNYHLQYLVGRGIIEKSAGLYALTTAGQKYLMELNPVTPMGESHRFKLASMCLVVRGQGPALQLLYQRRGRQPHAGEEGAIGGGIKRGELATATAQRRLWEEAGLHGTFSLLGLIRKRHFDPDGDIFSDILFHVCICRDSRGELVEHNDFGEQSWRPIDEAIAIETNGAVGSPQLGQVLHQLKATPINEIPLFYFEETYQREIY